MNIKTFSHCLHMKYAMPLFVVVGMFLVAACGGGSGGTTGTGSTPTATTGGIAATITAVIGSGTPSVTTSNTCSIVTTAQAGMILGGTVQTRSFTESIATTTLKICQYNSSQQGAEATLGVAGAADPTTAHTLFAELQQSLKTTSGSNYQDVSGLGDEAFYTGSVLYVRKGKTLMVITVTHTDSTKILSDEKQFAQDALPNVS